MENINITGYIIIINLLAALIVSGNSASMTSEVYDVSRVDCTLDDDSTNPTLTQCLTLGEEFAEQYEKYFRKGKEFDRCASFAPFHACLEPLVTHCPQLRKTLNHKWRNIYEVMKCACTGNTDCNHKIECMEDEHRSIYMNLCQEMYDFNIDQNTHGKCRFMKEKLDCEASLIASACGEEVSGFYSSLAKVDTRKHKCYMTPPHNHSPNSQAFRYTEQCPTNITEKIQQCTQMHPVESVLHFYQDNDLIVEDSRKKLKLSCRSFVKYQACFDDIRQSCPEGVKNILDYNGELRSYMLKMDYICSDAKKSYIDNMQCYRQVLANETFSKCNHIWEGLLENLYNLTSYQFYCQLDHRGTIQVRAALKEIEHCYEDILTEQCGADGGKTMSRLIEKAFQDPFYLQYRFKPDCKLHDPDPPSRDIQHNPSSAAHSTTTISTTTIHRLKNPPSSKPKRNPVGGKSKPNTAHNNSNSVASYSLCLLSTTFVSWFLLASVPVLYNIS